MWTILIGALAGLVLYGAGSALADHFRDRAEARRRVRDWDAFVSAHMGMVWNPITRTYEKPPGTLPWKPPPPRYHWWDYPVGDLVLVTLSLYASWRLRKDNRRGDHG